MKPLLLLVDLQRDFLSSRSLEPSAGTLVDRASALLRQCRERRIPVAHLWTTICRRPDNRMAHWKERGLWRCVEGTPGHEPPPELVPAPDEIVVHKSGFSGLADPSLLRSIRSDAIDTVWVAGVHLHACVRQAVLDAYQQGLCVWVAEDAVGSDDPIHAAITRRYLEARSTVFFRVDELRNRMAGPVEAGDDATEDESSASGSVQAAASFSRRWRSQSLEARCSVIEALASRLSEAGGDLPERMATEIGKPIRYGRGEVQRTVELLHDVVRCARIPTESEGDAAAAVRRRPHGVVAVITPWNNPVYIALGKIGPAVLHGNTVVWKPAPEARELSRRLMAMFEESGWPGDLVRLVEGGRRVAAAVMDDERVGAVTLTGSSLAGSTAQEICSRRRIPLQAELGGNNAAVVWPDADLDSAAHAVACGAFEMTGQRCTANRRVVVHQDCRDLLVEKLVASASRLGWGDPLAEAIHVGPLVSRRQREAVTGMVDRARAAGARVLLPHGEVHPPSQGWWYPPTIVCCDDPNAEIVQEESFGPVLVVQSASSWEQAMALCNGVRQGLAASVFTSSSEIARRFLDEAVAGILKINQSTADAAVGAPFGGWKASGLGLPEHGRCDREFFTRLQTVYGDPGPLARSPDRPSSG